MSAFVNFLKEVPGSAGGLASAGSSVIGSVTSAIGAKRAYNRQKALMKRQQAYQTQERLDSQSWQERMWRMTNDYNSPLQTMDRLRQAGLNPDMMYSQNGINASIAGSLPGSTASGAPSVPQPAGESLLAQSSQFAGNAAKNAAEIALMKSQTELNEEKSETEGTIRMKNGSDIIVNEQLAKKYGEEVKKIAIEIDNARATGDQIRAQTDLLRSQEAINGEELKRIKKEYELFEKQFDDFVKQSYYNTRRAAAEAGISEDTYYYTASYMRAQIVKLYSGAILDNASAYNQNQQGELAYFQSKAQESENAANLKEYRFKGSDGKYITGNYFELLKSFTLDSLGISVNDAQALFEHNENYRDVYAFTEIWNNFMVGLGSMIGAIFTGSKGRMNQLPGVPGSAPRSYPQADVPKGAPNPYFNTSKTYR